VCVCVRACVRERQHARVSEGESFCCCKLYSFISFSFSFYAASLAAIVVAVVAAEGGAVQLLLSL